VVSRKTIRTSATGLATLLPGISAPKETKVDPLVEKGEEGPSGVHRVDRRQSRMPMILAATLALAPPPAALMCEPWKEGNYHATQFEGSVYARKAQ
jgi:hypothetical protein